MRRTINNGYVQFGTGLDNYIGSVAGMRSFRARVISSGAFSGSIAGTTQRFQHTLEGIEVGPPGDFFTSVVAGDVAGYAVVNKFGRNPNISPSNVPADVWNGGGAYPGFPVGVTGLVRLSSNQTGDAALGFGARTVNIIGLDQNFNIQNEGFTLNGLTPVTGTRNFTRVHTASVQTAGLSGANLGEITCQHIPPNQADVFFRMPTGTAQTYVGAYTVPAGKTAYLKQFSASLNRGTGIGAPTSREADICLYARVFSGVFRQRRPSNLSNNAPLDSTILGGLMFPEKTDITVRCTAVATDTTVDLSSSFDMVLIDN